MYDNIWLFVYRNTSNLFLATLRLHCARTSKRLFQKYWIKSHSQNKWSMLSTAMLQNVHKLDAAYLHLSRYLFVAMFLCVKLYWKFCNLLSLKVSKTFEYISFQFKLFSGKAASYCSQFMSIPNGYVLVKIVDSRLIIKV